MNSRPLVSTVLTTMSRIKQPDNTSNWYRLRRDSVRQFVTIKALSIVKATNRIFLV